MFIFSTSLGELLRKLEMYEDQRWSSNRAVLDVRTHPKFNELFLVSYAQKTDASMHDPDGCALVSISCISVTISCTTLVYSDGLSIPLLYWVISCYLDLEYVDAATSRICVFMSSRKFRNIPLLHSLMSLFSLKSVRQCLIHIVIIM